MANTYDPNRIDPFTFRIFGRFDRAEDRTTQDYNKGRFFYFKYFGGQFAIQIYDREDFDNPPKANTPLWINGLIFSNQSNELDLRITGFSEPTDQNPAPSVFEQNEGGYFQGLGMIEKSTFTRASGDLGYKFSYRGEGLLHSAIVEKSVYERFPTNEFVVLRGRLRVEERFNSRYNSKTSRFSLVPTEALNYREILEKQQRRAAASSDKDSTSDTSRRQGAAPK